MVADAVSPPVPRPAAPAAAPLEDREVPLQVTIPKRVRRQLDRLVFEREETMRALILRAVRSLGIEVSDDELKDRRGRRGP
jgi:hypothetical protein